MAAAAILQNRKIATSQNGMTDFNEIWLGDADSWAIRMLKIWNFKTPRWRRPPWRNVEKSPYLGNGLTDFDQIWYIDAVRPFYAIRPLKI